MNRYVVATWRPLISVLRGGLGLLLVLMSNGCRLPSRSSPDIPPPPVVGMNRPRELNKVLLPDYIIEAPDILSIEAIQVVPKAPYRIRTLDVLAVQIASELPIAQSTEAALAGEFPVLVGGIIDLGPVYGKVTVFGLTVEEARQAITSRVRQTLREPQVNVYLVQLGAPQQIAGEYIVGPDGAVTLGSYGSVRVVGMTVAEAKRVVEAYLGRYLEAPAISLSVAAYNSKVFYVIMQGAGLGDGIFRLPVTGNETVLDALSQLNGLELVSSKKIWIARPNREPGSVQILPVDYYAITELAETNTNYQLLPGDRLFVAEDKLVAFDTAIAKFTAPLERIFGFSILGAETATRLSGSVLKGGGNPSGFR